MPRYEVVGRTFGRPTGSFLGQDYASSDQQYASPARPRDVVVQEKMAQQRYQHVRASGDGQHETKVRPAEKRQVGKHPDNQNDDTDRGGGICKGFQVIQRRSGDDTANLMHTAAQKNVPEDIGDDNHQNQNLGLSRPPVVFGTGNLRSGFDCRLERGVHGAEKDCTESSRAPRNWSLNGKECKYSQKKPGASELDLV